MRIPLVVGLFLPWRFRWHFCHRFHAETRTAADLTPEAVGKAIDAAKDGDIVQLPAGTAVWSKKGWHTGHSPKVKAITIQGAGIDKTIITVDKSKSGNTYFELEGVEGKPFRVTGITLDGSLHPDEASWGALMSISGTCKNFRIDHCKFKNSDVMLMINGGGDRGTYGLVDHCCFDGQLSHGGCLQPICYSGPGAPTIASRSPWAPPRRCTSRTTRSISGGPWRRATTRLLWPSTPPASSSATTKSSMRKSKSTAPGRESTAARPAEIYDNQFATVNGGRPGGFIFIAAGAAIVFNNTVTGATYDCRVIQLTNHRAFMEMPPWGKADGKNPLDGNQIPAGQVGAGYPCFGQVGWATNVDGVFKPSPCYAWNNTFNGAKLLDGRGRQRSEPGGDRSRKAANSSTRSRRPNTTSRTSILIRFNTAGRR